MACIWPSHVSYTVDNTQFQTTEKKTCKHVKEKNYKVEI